MMKITKLKYSLYGNKVELIVRKKIPIFISLLYKKFELNILKSEKLLLET